MTDYRLWKTALSCKALDAAAFDDYRDAGIDMIEISGRWDDYPLFDFEDIKRQSDRTGVEIRSLHLPFSRDINISLPDAEKRESTLKTDMYYMEKAAAVGAGVIVVHPSSEPIAESERTVYMEHSKNSLGILADKAQELGVTLAVENLPRTCLCRDSDEMAEILDSDKRLRFCFDVNHLLCDSHARFIERFADRLVTLHISDYDFVNERHALPGDGLIDWNRLVTLLERADYSGPFLYEVSLEGKSDGDYPFPAHSVSDVRKNHMDIKSFTGSGKRL